jgi:D-alanyl-D-alanine carboxypeptidase/D-alanyl-D-alanine-endopeptidase (penicillin-binding protein 4)
VNALKLFVTTCFMLAWLAGAAAAAPAAPKSAPGPAIAKAPSLQDRAADIAARFERAGLGRAGIAAVDLLTGRQVLAVRADEPFMPASNQKLLTSVFALERLGADFRFATGAYVLDGDVVVSGEFDPTFGDPLIAAEAGRDIYAELDRWAAAVRAAVAGKPVRDVLVVSPHGWPARHPDWPAAQRDDWFAAPVGTLNFNDNCMDVSFAGPAGKPTPVLSPAGRLIRIDNRLTISPGKPNRWSLRGAGNEQTFVLSGVVGQAGGEPISVAVDNPDLLLGRTLADRLERAGVKVAGTVRRVLPDQIDWARARVVAATQTTLFAALNRANKRSLNMVAECILLRAGDGTWPGSAQMLARTLTEQFRLPPASVSPADGSGLSRKNLVTPAAMAGVLAAAARRNYAMVLLRSLPVAGVDGTLSKRFLKSPCRGRVLGKTGYIAGVSALSGYVLDEQGQVRYAFSVLGNRLRSGTDPAKDLQETVCEMLHENAAAGNTKRRS